VHHDFGHPARRPIASTLEDDVLHLTAAQVLNALLAKDPRDRVGYVALTATIWANDGSDPISCKDYFGVVGEGFKPSDFQTLEFEHLLFYVSVLGQPLRLLVGRREIFHTGEPL
jgi:hypothetical protein